jgi:hypothetical protein
MLDVLMLFPATANAAEVDEVLDRIAGGWVTAPGIQSLRRSQGQLMSPGAPPPFSRVLEATFDSLEAFIAQVPGPDRAEEREALDRLAPLIIFFEARPA